LSRRALISLLSEDQAVVDPNKEGLFLGKLRRRSVRRKNGRNTIGDE
jgi:hypothetical protein